MGDKIVNVKQPLFDGVGPNRLYYSDFGDTNNADNKLLYYGEYIQYQKEVEFNDAYIESLDNYM